MRDILLSARRTPYQSLAAFLVLFLILFLSVIILFSLSFLYGFLGYVETRPQVTVYFQNQTTEDEIVRIKDELVASGKILSVKYISKQEAFVLYKELNKDNPLLLEMVSSDILPASLEIYAKKPSYLPEIAEFLKKQPGVDEVNFQKVIIERLLMITMIVRRIALVFVGYLILTTILILMTIVHFKVALKKEEIELLKLLGATHGYIRTPFLYEGMLFGLFSSLIAYAIFVGGLAYLSPFLTSYLRDINALSINLDAYQITVWPLNIVFMGMLFGFILLFGMAISAAASFLATQKYIK